MSIDTLALKLHERDINEQEYAFWCVNIQNIKRNDEIDYEIDQELRR